MSASPRRITKTALARGIEIWFAGSAGEDSPHPVDDPRRPRLLAGSAVAWLPLVTTVHGLAEDSLVLDRGAQAPGDLVVPGVLGINLEQPVGPARLGDPSRARCGQV